MRDSAGKLTFSIHEFDRLESRPLCVQDAFSADGAFVKPPPIVAFTTVKPMTSFDANIQRYAVASWSTWADDTAVIGDDLGAEELASECGATFIPNVKRRSSGLPEVDSLFRRIRAEFPDHVFVYLNSDIVIDGDLRGAIRLAGKEFSEYLLIARRFELQLTTEQVRSLSDSTVRAAQESSLLAPDHALDMFAYSANAAVDPPPLAVGKAGWDNWMVYDARRRHIPVVDISPHVSLLHLDVELGWASGKSTPTDQDTLRNRELVGEGRLFGLPNATHVLQQDRLQARHRLSVANLLREQVALRPGLARAVRPLRSVLSDLSDAATGLLRLNR